MSNRISKKRKLDPDIFKQYIKEKNLSIRDLGRELETTEKTIRRCVESKSVTITVAIEICEYFQENCSSIFGPDDSAEWRNLRRYLD